MATGTGRRDSLQIGMSSAPARAAGRMYRTVGYLLAHSPVAPHVERAIQLLVVPRVAERPVPPLKVMQSSVGPSHSLAMIAVQYAATGLAAADDIQVLLRRNGMAMVDFRRVLDFGCGSGRVIRYWQELPGEVHGSDYNESAIVWCRQNLPFAFNVNGVEPPLAYNDETFDFVYALSVFTHLDGPRQRAWLEELMRVVRPGGHLMFTTHGDRWLRSLSEEQISRFRLGELVLKGDGSVGSNSFGAFQSSDQVRRELLAGKDIVDYAAWGSVGTGGQDSWLVRKS